MNYQHPPLMKFDYVYSGKNSLFLIPILQITLSGRPWHINSRDRKTKSLLAAAAKVRVMQCNHSVISFIFNLHDSVRQLRIQAVSCPQSVTFCSTVSMCVLLHVGSSVSKGLEAWAVISQELFSR